jgi:hypothetical protein
MSANEATINPLPPPGEAFYTTLNTFLHHEDAARFQLIFQSHVISGGVHGPVAGLTGTPSPMVAICNGFYTTEVASITYNNNDTTYVIANEFLTGNADTYTRVAGTHFLTDNSSGSEPILPTGAVRLMTVTTSGGAITHVDDRRFLSPIRETLYLSYQPWGNQAAGPLKVLVDNADNVNGYQAIMAQMVNGDHNGVGLVTLGNDKVAISGWSFRGSAGGGASPLYGANFGVVFDSPGVANGCEIDVQNNSGTDGIGQGLWVNGSGLKHRSNAILIDTQDATKWTNGIKFQSFTGGGATGNVTNAGILFEGNQSQNQILIIPYDDINPSNNVFELRDSIFSAPPRAGIQKRGAFAGRGATTDVNNPTFTFTDDPRVGLFQPAPGQLGFCTAGFMVFKIVNGMLVSDGFGALADKGMGTINLWNDIYHRDTAYTFPDYVFEHYATGGIDRFRTSPGAADYEGLQPLAVIEAYVREHWRFPHLDRLDDPGLFSGGDAILATLEEGYCYLFDHERRLCALEAAMKGAR